MEECNCILAWGLGTLGWVIAAFWVYIYYRK